MTYESAHAPATAFRNTQPILTLKGISKYFGHVRALEDVDFELYPNEVLALVGDNGAGKSTLIKCISGVHPPDRGQVFVDGAPVKLRDPAHATELGIATVYQDLALVDSRDVASNIFLGEEPTRGRFIVDRAKILTEARERIRDLKIKIPSVESLVQFLSGGQRQGVAIARAIQRGGRILIMDEPTAALGVEESGKIIDLIGELKTHGKSVIVISHNMRHVFSVADRIFVLRGGRSIGTRRKEETSVDEIVKMITGAEAV